MKKWLVLCLFLFCNFAYAELPKQIVFFGDSLSDNGNLYSTFFKRIPKSPPYYNGRFSNGPTWSDQVAQFYLHKYNIASLNYAVGGATASLHNPFAGFLPYPLSQEISHYLIPRPFAKKDDTLFVIWIGANDYLNGAENVDQATTKVVSDIKSSLQKLISKGGKHFVVMNLPDLAKTPIAKTMPNPENMHDLAVQHNQKLAAAVKQLQVANPSIQFVSIDIYTIFDDVLQNVDKYNQKYNLHLKNSTDTCWSGGYTLQRSDAEALNSELNKAGMTEAPALLKAPALAEAYKVTKAYGLGATPCDQPDDYLFWDAVHPSAAVHQMFGQIVIDELMATFAKA